MVCSNVGIRCIASVVNEWKWHYSNGGIITNRGEPKYSKKSVPPCRYAHHKSHMDCRPKEHGPPMWQAGNKPPELRHGPFEVGFELQWTPGITRGGQLPGSLRRHWNIVNMELLTRGCNTRKNFWEIYSQFWHAHCPRKKTEQCLATFSIVKIFFVINPGFLTTSSLHFFLLLLFRLQSIST